MSSLQAHARISSSDASNDASADERTLYDPNSDDEAPYDGRPSGDFSEGDNGILESEDEREKLLMGRKGVKIGKRKEMKEVKRGKSGRRGAEEESASLMYEMDGGIEGSSESLVGMRRGGRHREEDERVGIADGMARKVWCFSSS